MQQTLMQQGVDLLIYGMGTVFVFLTVLVFITLIMSAIVRRFFPDVNDSNVVCGGASASQVPPRIMAAIKAAIKQHRG